ncbi:MAG: hypothetical protein ACLT8E_01785 [Akkermansia sp.]
MGPRWPMKWPCNSTPTPSPSSVRVRRQRQLLHPIGYQTNTYVYNAGGYQFKDFVKVGRLNILLWIIFTCTVGWLYPLK